MKNYDDSIEKSILFCLITKPRLFEEIVIQEKHFLKYKTVFQFFRNTYLKYKTLDTTLILDEPNSPISVEELLSIINDVAAFPSNFYSYEEKLIERYKEFCITKLAEKLENKELSVEEFIEKIGMLNNENLTISKTKTPDEIYNLITSTKKYIIFNNFTDLGRKVKFIKNTFNLIAARPSIGKSAFAINLLEDLSRTYKCLYFSLEMSESEMYERLVSIKTQIPIDNLTTPSKHQSNLMQNAINELTSRNMKLICGSKNFQTLNRIIINEQKDEHLIVFIDYLGLITMPEYKSLSDTQRIGEITRRLEDLVQDYNITIFCLAQINREGTERPTLTNLKDSGELEQAGHAILLLHNTSNDPLNAPEPEMEIIVAKNRSSRPGFITMKYRKDIQTFIEEVQYAKI